MKKSDFRSVKSFHADAGEWEKFQFNTRLLNISQTDIINKLIKDWNIDSKSAVDEVIRKGRGE